MYFFAIVANYRQIAIDFDINDNYCKLYAEEVNTMITSYTKRCTFGFSIEWGSFLDNFHTFSSMPGHLSRITMHLSFYCLDFHTYSLLCYTRICSMPNA